jgi:hypothetical protein
MSWFPIDDGKTIGEKGSENGVILLDEEFSLGARITLERDGYTPFAITCGIYGALVHTIFFSDENDARRAYNEIKLELEELINQLPLDNDPDYQVKLEIIYKAIRAFVDRH